MEQIKNFISWYQYTARPIGLVVLGIVMFYALKIGIFTATCYTLNYKCELSYGAENALINYMGDMLAANPDTDIVAKRRSK